MTRSCLALAFSCVLSVACSSPESSIATTTPEPSGPFGEVARDASEAFPEAPQAVPALSRDALLRACVRAAECQVGQPPSSPITAADALGLVGICVSALEFSAERAIPISGWMSRASTADVWAACVTAGPACDDVRACDVARPGVTCEEDGCRGPSGWVETRCAGDQATIVTKTSQSTRDCALAHARCDVASPTGCTDRPYTRCPDGAPHVDRCDGDVRLGCDGQGQVSYRDCRRLGGTCGLDARGTYDCVYPDTDACAGTAPPSLGCAEGELAMCVLGARVTALSTALCP
ncbi:MAG: hypothetical protein IT374_02870 [Polyangiaceae bacterium]|nr:hypothetical protein [Polyangiaceae bacterium]